MEALNALIGFPFLILNLIMIYYTKSLHHNLYNHTQDFHDPGIPNAKIHDKLNQLLLHIFQKHKFYQHIVLLGSDGSSPSDSSL